LPLTLGHEVAGVVEQVGAEVKGFRLGDRVCLHYLATCGECAFCRDNNEQFCPHGAMIGKHRDGGYAEFILMPGRSVFPLPDATPFPAGAIMMCSSATSLHALSKARMCAGETVAVFGAGGLGVSAIQLAKAFGAGAVFAVDINPRKLELAERFGAVPVNAAKTEPVAAIRDLTQGRGADVALELIGLPLTMQQAIRSLAIKGRAALVGITDKTFPVAPYHEIINKEAEIIGVSDHLAQEIPLLTGLVTSRKLDLSNVVTRSVPLTAQAINDTLDALENFGDDVRVVVEP
jgi:propanol-preferring alcohol dehydrogenase